MVVCYKLSSITWFLAQKMSSVKELLQNDMNANNITKQIIYLLSEEGQEKTKTDYRELINSLTSKTNPYKEAAKYILQ